MDNEGLQSVPWHRFSDAVDRLLTGPWSGDGRGARVALLCAYLTEMRRRTAAGAFSAFAAPDEPETETKPGTGSRIPIGGFREGAGGAGGEEFTGERPFATRAEPKPARKPEPRIEHSWDRARRARQLREIIESAEPVAEPEPVRAVKLPASWAEPIEFASVVKEVEPKTEPPTFVMTVAEPVAEPEPVPSKFFEAWREFVHPARPGEPEPAHSWDVRSTEIAGEPVLAMSLRTEPEPRIDFGRGPRPGGRGVRYAEPEPRIDFGRGPRPGERGVRYAEPHSLEARTDGAEVTTYHEGQPHSRYHFEPTKDPDDEEHAERERRRREFEPTDDAREAPDFAALEARVMAAVAEPPAPPARDPNQCDGCAAGMPLKDGTHQYPDGPWSGMVCTKDRYSSAPEPAFYTPCTCGLRPCPHIGGNGKARS